MSRVTDVLAELESIGAVGDKVLLLRMETPKVVPELRAVPANLASLDEQLAAQQARFDEERHQWAVLVEIAGTKLEALAAETQELRKVFQQMNEAIANQGGSNETIQEEA